MLAFVFGTKTSFGPLLEQSEVLRVEALDAGLICRYENALVESTLIHGCRVLPASSCRR